MTSNYRNIIYNKLRTRNKREKDSFSGLIAIHSKLFEQVEKCKNENLQLSIQNEKLRQGTPLPITPNSPGISYESNRQLEQKIYKLSEELTDLHRRKGELTETLMEMKNDSEAKNTLLATQIQKISDLEYKLSEKENEIADLTAINEMLKDEYQTINLSHNTLEEKLRQLTSENRELLERYLALKAQDVERMNAEISLNQNTIHKQRQEQIEQNLKEASAEPKIVILDDNGTSPYVCISSSVPTQAYHSFDAHDGEVNTIMFSPQGRLVATGGADRKIKLWEVNHGKEEAKGTLTGSNAGITNIDFDTEGSLIVGSSNDYACRVWTVVDYRLRHTLTGHSNKVMSAKFLNESNKVVTGSHDRTLKIWDLRGRCCIRTIFAGSSCNDLVASDGAATTIISGHVDRKVRFYDTRSEQQLKEIPLQGKITSLCLSIDGFYLLCCARDDNLRLIDLRKDKICASYSTEDFRVGVDYTRAVFSPDSSYVVVGGANGSIYIWNTHTTALEKTLAKHSATVISCSWNPDGKNLVSCDRNKSVVCWTSI